MTWFVVHDRLDWDDSSLEEGEAPPRIYTISRDPNLPGWETDCGQDRYGLTKADADEIVEKLNFFEALPSPDEPPLERRLAEYAGYINAFAGRNGLPGGTTRKWWKKMAEDLFQAALVMRGIAKP